MEKRKMKPPKKPSIRIRRNAKDGELKLLEYLLKIRKLRASYELADGDAKDTTSVELLNLLRIANGDKALSALQFSELSEKSKRNVDKYVVKGLDCFKEVPRCTPANKSAIRYSLDLIYSPITIGFVLCCSPDFDSIPYTKRKIEIVAFADIIDSVYFGKFAPDSQAQELLNFFDAKNSVIDTRAPIYWSRSRDLDKNDKFVTCDKCKSRIIPIVDSTAKVRKIKSVPSRIRYEKSTEFLNGFKLQYCHCINCNRHMVRLIECKSKNAVEPIEVIENRHAANETYKGMKSLNMEKENAPQVLNSKFLTICDQCGFLVDPKLNHYTESEAKKKDGQILTHRICPHCGRRMTRYEDTEN